MNKKHQPNFLCRIQTENVARLANTQATGAQAALYQTLEKRLSESSKRHVETKSKLTKIEKSLEKTKNIAIDTLASFDEFLGTQSPDSFVETYGVGEFIKSIQYVFKELRKHLKNSSGTNLLVSDSRLRYSEAQAACRDIGAQLVTILDEEKMEAVLKAVAGFKRWDIWIGLNRLNKVRGFYLLFINYNHFDLRKNMSGIQAKILNFHHGETGSRTGEILTEKTEKRSASSCGPTKHGTIITAE